MLEAAGTLIAPEGDEEALSPDRLRQATSEAQAMMAFMPDWVDDAFLAERPKLRIVAAALKGYDNFDGEACARRGVWLSIVPDLLTVPSAELTIGLMIGLARHVRAGDAHLRSGTFNGWRPAFYGRGMARRDRRLHRLRRHRPRGRAAAAPVRHDAGLHRSQTASGSGRTGPRRHPPAFDEVVARADYLISAAPLTPATRHLLGADALSRIKPGALLINPSRGSVVDEQAVAAALRDGRLGGYAADVFEMEDWLLADRPRAVAPELLTIRRRCSRRIWVRPWSVPARRSRRAPRPTSSTAWRDAPRATRSMVRACQPANEGQRPLYRRLETSLRWAKAHHQRHRHGGRRPIINSIVMVRR